MNSRTILSGTPSIVIALMMTLAAPRAVLAAHGGGAHGGSGGAYSGHFGSRIGGYGGGYRGRGGYSGDYRWRGGYGYYGGWGWDGLGYDLSLGALPLYYSTLWWNDVPYYYANANYYAWNSAALEYETVRPPRQVESQIATQEPTATALFAYPKSGQNTEQQTQDRYECHHWATDQTGFDPTQSGDVPPAASTPAGGTVVATTVAEPIKRQDYLRAQAACLEARGYSVK